MAEDFILEMKNIVKSFPGVRALKGVSFDVRRGEIHCLVGENGAGKSTLMKVLSGVHPHGTYDGEIVMNGETQVFRNIADSEAKGIAIIYQELALVPEMSIYENIFLGHELMHGRTIDWNETIERSRALLSQVGLAIDPSLKVGTLGIGTQQLIEVAKALSKDVNLLIYDEPTAALNDRDSAHLLNLMRGLKDQGVTCIMISHKLHEVISIADRVTVLRDGETITTIDRDSGDINEPYIIRHMVGRELVDNYPARVPVKSDEVLLEVRNWNVHDPRSGRHILQDINFHVNKGEIVGIQGLMGAGRTELALSLFGNVPHYRITSGEVYFEGKKQSWTTPRKALDRGIAYVSEDRKRNGLILIQDVRFNITIANLQALLEGLVIDKNKEIVVANEYKDSINIRTPSIEQTVMNLSGGNQQKVQIAKSLFSRPRLLILDEPTRGIDVGAKFEIYSLMVRLIEEGMSILMISSELPEILGMSDRVYVLAAGRITGELSREEATQERVMELALKETKRDA